MIVVDTNVLASFLIAGPFTAFAEAAYARGEWCAPLLWRSEFRNVLTNYFRNGSYSGSDIRELMKKAETLMWGREFTVRSSAILDCIVSSKRSAYDCEFVALAQDLGMPLVTIDEPVIREFPGVAIHLRDFVVPS